MAIIDIVLLAITGITAIIGVIRGFGKQFYVYIGGMIQYVGTIVLVCVLVPALMGTDLGMQITSGIGGWFQVDATTTYQSAEELIPILTNAGAPEVAAKLLASVLLALAPTANTLQSACGYIVGSAIVGIVLFIAIFLLLKLMLFGLGKLITLMLKFQVMKFIDHLFGIVFACAFLYVIYSLLLAGIQAIPADFVPNVMTPIRETIANSEINAFLYENNMIGAWIFQLFHFTPTV